MDNSRHHMMQCLARELLTWKLPARQKFLREWEFGRKGSSTARSLPAKGKAAGDELREHLTEQHSILKTKADEARKTIREILK